MAPIPDHVRDAVLADVRDHPDTSARALAERHGISKTSVQRIAAAAGLSVGAAGRTWAATAARVETAAARRALLRERLLDHAHACLDRVGQDVTTTTYQPAGESGPGYWTDHEYPPTPADLRNLYTSVAVITDKLLALDRADTSGERTAGEALVDRLAEQLDGLRGTPAA